MFPSCGLTVILKKYNLDNYDWIKSKDKTDEKDENGEIKFKKIDNDNLNSGCGGNCECTE